MNALRHLLPFGLVRWLQFTRQLRDLGVARARAWRLALDPGMPARLGRLDLDLFPPGALAALETVVDVGANDGEWAAAVLEICEPRRVVCIEPLPELARGLRERFAGAAAVQVLECAAGPAGGDAVLHVTRNPLLNSVLRPAPAMTSLFPGHFEVERSVAVQVRPLDEIAAGLDRVSLLKVDAQGYEREVLLGATQTLRRTDFVLVEVDFQAQYEGGADFAAMDALMRSRGFAIANYSRPRGGRPQALYADVLYVPVAP